MIEIKFPADRKDIAEAMGRALLALADCTSGDVAEKQTSPDRLPTPYGVPDGPIDSGTATPPDAQSSPPPEPGDDAGPKLAPGGHGGPAEGVAEAETNQTSPVGAQVDEYGVAFDGDYCGQAKDPLYGSGPRKGQWKKRKGVSEDVYDEWHAAQREQAHRQEDQQPASLFDSSAAFAKPEDAREQAPKDVGELFAWISKRQAAKELTYQDVQDAHARTGITSYQLFNAPAEQQAQHIKAIWEELK